MREQGSGYLARPAPSGLADVVEIILDKGVVIDAYVRVSLVGIELMTVDARIVVSSVDTYLRFAEATNRLDLSDKGGKSPAALVTDGLGEVTERVASTVVESKVEKGGNVDPVKRAVGGAVEKVVDVAEEAANRADVLIQKVRTDG